MLLAFINGKRLIKEAKGLQGLEFFSCRCTIYAKKSLKSNALIHIIIHYYIIYYMDTFFYIVSLTAEVSLK